MPDTDELGRAVSYLRVSSKRQMDTAIDIDPDGNSIATQREHVASRVATLGTTVQREFLEPARQPRPSRSGRSSANCCTICATIPARSTMSSSTCAPAPSVTTSTPG